MLDTVWHPSPEGKRQLRVRIAQASKRAMNYSHQPLRTNASCIKSQCLFDTQNCFEKGARHQQLPSSNGGAFYNSVQALK